MSGQNTQTAVAQRQQAQPPSLVDHVRQKLWPEMQRVLPQHLGADRMMRLALTVLRKNPKLAECDPASYVGALLTADALGLDPGVDGEAYLVPYKRECTLIVGYQGYAKLFWQHPLAQHLECRAVYDNDEFDYEYGLSPYLRHKPARNHDNARITDYYAVAKLSSGASAFAVLTADEVKELRRGKVGPNGDIPDPQHWMERKTVLRQLVKLLPKSKGLANAAVVDEQRGSQLAAQKVPQAIDAGAEVIEPPVDVDQATGELPPEPEPVDEPATQAQLKAIHAALREIGYVDDDDKHRAMSTVAGRPISSSTELTKAEASKLVGILGRCPSGEDGKVAFADELAAIRENAGG